MEEQKELIKSIEKWLPFEIDNLDEYVGGLYEKRSITRAYRKC